jgi:hypothetical protein
MSSKENEQGLRIIGAKKKESQALYKKFGRWVQINRHKYKIKFCQAIEYRGQGALGLCDPDSKTLYICVHGNITSTLVHEITHAESFESGFKQRERWCDDNEEHLAETLGESIGLNYELIRKTT